jgi:hypothetical protein
MVADGILSWLSFAGIPHAAIDTDVQHHTLSDRYKMHLLDATSSEDEFEQLLENLPESPTLIVDFPGNKTSKILEFADMLKSFRASRHPAHTPDIHRGRFDCKDSALETLEFFGDAADYLLIEYSVRFKSDSFKATPLYDPVCGAQLSYAGCSPDLGWNIECIGSGTTPTRGISLAGQDQQRTV